MWSADDGSRRIDEELISVDSLKHVLCTRCGCSEVRLLREEHDPPDFTVYIDGESFPAEVTSTVFRQQDFAQYRDLARTIRDRATSLGVLSGNYVLRVSRFPDLPKPSSSNGRALLDAAVAYVDSTQLQVTCAETQLTSDSSGRIRLAKVSSNGATVGLIWAPPAKWAIEVQSELAMLIQQAVDVKRRKLQKAGIGPQRALLVLYDAYGYAQPSDVASAMNRVSQYDWFHSIFWAASFTDRRNTSYLEEPGREGLFLFSHNRTWRGVGSVSPDRGT